MELSKLSKSQINELVKSLPPRFVCIIPSSISHNNKKFKNHLPKDDNIIELYDKGTADMYDLWGMYSKKDNAIYITAWDYICNCAVGVYLYEDHFEIPKYRLDSNNYETLENYKAYREKLHELLAQNENDIRVD